MSKLRVDIDELMYKLAEMKEEGFVTTEIEINEGEYESDNELSLYAIDIENDDEIHFGSLNNLIEEI